MSTEYILCIRYDCIDTINIYVYMDILHKYLALTLPLPDIYILYLMTNTY